MARRLAALEQVRDATRDRLAETLLAWLVHRGQRQPTAETLHVHPQTVGYRLRRRCRTHGSGSRRAQMRVQARMARAVTVVAVRS
ncbi:MAG TPA: helix-turn-helix domain-containing protein [Frankiaceae bacterium]|nr:helix-turn-helix domain-containing protein [Frankiaceae bacterium]